ncbi:hypothetical protein PsYK624_155080 [Phanerochaete sordida]|uniref:Uncharacterized protein n=1 Tax=Phanerochaete sordida TaxID=48140 RepID=A0A9P3GNZ9_9APHY|nr:hypothetical protein PsYK624_155080 [Phanerochaete sordida]
MSAHFVAQRGSGSRHAVFNCLRPPPPYRSTACLSNLAPQAVLEYFSEGGTDFLSPATAFTSMAPTSHQSHLIPTS